MSPLIHAEIGWLLSLPLGKRRDRMLIVGAAVIPDLDGIGIIVSEQLYADWHHVLAHGAIAAVVVTLGVGLWARSPRAAVLAFAAFHSHIAMDLCGSGPGWPIHYLWPFSPESSWLPSWQWDLASWQNSLFGLVTTLGALACALRFGRTPVEIVSTRWDAQVVQALRARFAK